MYIDDGVWLRERTVLKSIYIIYSKLRFIKEPLFLKNRNKTPFKLVILTSLFSIQVFFNTFPPLSSASSFSGTKHIVLSLLLPLWYCATSLYFSQVKSCNKMSSITEAQPTIRFITTLNSVQVPELLLSAKKATWSRYVSLSVCLITACLSNAFIISFSKSSSCLTLHLTSPIINLWFSRRAFSLVVSPCATPWLKASTVMKWVMF